MLNYLFLKNFQSDLTFKTIKKSFTLVVSLKQNLKSYLFSIVKTDTQIKAAYSSFYLNCKLWKQLLLKNRGIQSDLFLKF